MVVTRRDNARVRIKRCRALNGSSAAKNELETGGDRGAAILVETPAYAGHPDSL